MSHCARRSKHWSDRKARLSRFVLSLGVLSFFQPSSAQAVRPGPTSSYDQTSHYFHSYLPGVTVQLQSGSPFFSRSPFLFLVHVFLQWPPTCFWFLSFPSLLVFLFFLLLPLSSHDELHSSNSSISKSKMQPTPWAHTGLAVRLAFFPSFHFFSAQSRPPAKLHRLQHVVHVGLQMFALLVIALGRSFLLNFFCSKNLRTSILKIFSASRTSSHRLTHVS